METPANDERATLPRSFEFAKAFRKDRTRLSRSGRYDMRRLEEAMLLLIARDTPPGPEWPDHELKGSWRGHHECRVGGEFLLIDRLPDDGDDAIVFVRPRTHAELFE